MKLSCHLKVDSFTNSPKSHMLSTLKCCFSLYLCIYPDVFICVLLCLDIVAIIGDKQIEIEIEKIITIHYINNKAHIADTLEVFVISYIGLS
jgi:hypothetical protein